MKIHLEFACLPMISDAVGKKNLEIEIVGKTVKDVIEELIRHYGKKVKDSFYDTDGNFNAMIQIALNREYFISADKHDTLLSEKDTLTFMLLVAGG